MGEQLAVFNVLHSQFYSASLFARIISRRVFSPAFAYFGGNGESAIALPQSLCDLGAYFTNCALESIGSVDSAGGDMIQCKTIDQLRRAGICSEEPKATAL